MNDIQKTKEKILNELDENKMDLQEAIHYIENNLNIEVVDVSNVKWSLTDEEMNFTLNSDKDLIEYAEEQKEAEEN